MARFRFRTRLAALPRPLPDEIVQAVLDAAEGMTFDDGGELRLGDGTLGAARLISGRHLAAGARYRIGLDAGETRTVDITVAGWDRTGRTALDVLVTAGGHTFTARLKADLRGEGLDVLRIDGSYRGPAFPRFLQRATVTAEMRLADRPAGGPARSRTPRLAVRVRHPFAEAAVAVAQGGSGRGRRPHTVTVGLRGRTAARPIAAVGLLVVRRRVRRVLGQALATAGTHWNEAVTAMAARGLQERLVLRHQVTVAAVPREAFGEYVRALHEAVEALRFRDGLLRSGDGPALDVRLLEGRHIEAGARYRVLPAHQDEDDAPPSDPLTVDVLSWDPAGGTRAAFRTAQDTTTGWAELRSARDPVLLHGRLVHESGSSPVLTRVTCEARADLEAWWRRSTRSAGDPAPITATAVHALGRATVTLTARPALGGRWKVAVSATVEGLSWGGPLVAVAALFTGHLLENALRKSAGEVAEELNRALPRLRTDPRKAAEATLDALLTA
ncbi:hypothetical protein [Actinomadura sp. 21ATH]|uniref:hypothetical protein n=1 Tax=Actinomadura sp. 21ATH TaxID=1735444 RepID=UPI0035C24B13